MAAQEVSASILLHHPVTGVWDFLTSTGTWAQWWWGEDALVRVDPAWGQGAHLVFASGWSPPVSQWDPPRLLAFGGHRFELTDVHGDTLLLWTHAPRPTSVGLDLLPGLAEEMSAQLHEEQQGSLARLAESLEASAATMGPGFAPAQADQGAHSPSAPEVSDLAPRQMRVFVSSTFKDMQVERDELARRTFVELRRACEERGVGWADVDLRWGITDEQRAEGDVLPVCLAEIDRCRPYFIGILGERYGWVPSPQPEGSVTADPHRAGDAGRSITDIEICHGVLDHPETAPTAFFYFRDPGYVDVLPAPVQEDHREGPTEDDVMRHGQVEAERLAADRRRRLADLKARILSSGLPVTQYREPRELSALVSRDLSAALDRAFPVESAPTTRERENLIHLAALREAGRGHTARPEDLHRVTERTSGDGAPLVVIGPTGSGKTALLADWVAARQRDHPDERVITHVVGASPQSASWVAMLQRLLGELAQGLEAVVEIPDEPRAVQRAFAAALHTAAAHARWVVVIDGLDQLEDHDGALDLHWLPTTVPAGIRLVVSTSPGRVEAELLRRGWPRLTVEPLDQEERRRLVRDHLARYGKSLSDAQLEKMSANIQMGSPLFATILLEELRLHGDPFTLDEAIDRHLNSEGLASLLDQVLGRFETDYERDRPGLVGAACSLLWAARRGLSEGELRDLLGAPGQALPGRVWSPFRLAALHLLPDRSDRLVLAHDAVRRAVETRYLPSVEQQQLAHLALAEYFQGREAGPRRAEELPWQYARLGRYDDVAQFLGDLDALHETWQADARDVRRYWAAVEAHHPGLMTETYRSSVETPPESTERVEVLATLLWNAGHLDESHRLRQTLTERARRRGDPLAVAVTLGNEAHVLQRQGAWDRALALYEEQADIARRHGHRRPLAVALGGQAAIHRKRGRLDRALALLREQSALLLRLDDQAGIQGSLGEQAQVLFEQAALPEALSLRREQERLCRELGHVDGLAQALEAQSVILFLQRDLAGALRLSRAAEETFRDLGDRAGLATVLANQALVLQQQGDLDGALSRLSETEQLCRAMGEQQDLVVALQGQAVIHGDRGDTDRALALLVEAEGICRSLDFGVGLLATLSNHARVLLQRGDTAAALDLLLEAEALGRRLGSPRPLAECLNLKGAALFRLGRTAEAEMVFREVRTIAEVHGLAPR